MVVFTGSRWRAFPSGGGGEVLLAIPSAPAPSPSGARRPRMRNCKRGLGEGARGRERGAREGGNALVREGENGRVPPACGGEIKAA